MASVVALQGCISLHSYPDTWEAPSPARADSCPDITGTYSNAGDRAGSSRGATLSAWLFDTGREPYVTFDRVAFDASGDELTMRAEGKDGVRTRSLSRSRGEFECADGVLKMPFSQQCCFDMMTMHTGGTLTLQRTPSYLVLGHSDVGAGVVIFLPVVFAERGYERFSPVAAPR